VNDGETCSVCGRTILGGEQTRTYLTPERERRTVCDLCRERAERVGWVWEEIAAGLPPAGGRRRPSLGALLRGRVGRRREEPEADVGPGADDVDPDAYLPPEPPSAPAEPEAEPAAGEEAPAVAAEPAPTAPPPAPPVPRGSPDPAARGAGIGRAVSPAESRMSRIESAIDRFNNSEQSVMTAGLTRTLGPPWVSIGTAAGSPGEVRVTVAWELSWYQWGIDISDELRPVYEIAKGAELDELDAPAKQWNARIEDSGRIELGRVPIGRPNGGAGGE
jgi:hypothetical protein